MIKVNTLVGYENVLDIYYIKNDGNVYSESMHKNLSQFDNGKGYKVASLKVKNIRKWKKAYIHILVALAYIPNEQNKPEVNHQDENKGNNKFDNLEWVTRLENVHYGNAIRNMSINKCSEVYVYDYLLNFKGVFYGMSEATRTILGYVETRHLNGRIKDYFFLDSEININKIIEIDKNSLYQTVVIKNIYNDEELIMPNNRRAREFFDNKINITDAIKKKWIVRGKYKIYQLDYSKYI